MKTLILVLTAVLFISFAKASVDFRRLEGSSVEQQAADILKSKCPMLFERENYAKYSNKRLMTAAGGRYTLELLFVADRSDGVAGTLKISFLTPVRETDPEFTFSNFETKPVDFCK